jgi:hypothetical protein
MDIELCMWKKPCQLTEYLYTFSRELYNISDKNLTNEINEFDFINKLESL